MNNVHGCVCSSISYQSCKCHLATDLAISHEVAINSPLGCDWSNLSGQKPVQRQQPHLLQLFHPYFHFLHPPPAPENRTRCATTCILMSLCGQKNVPTTCRGLTQVQPTTQPQHKNPGWNTTAQVTHHSPEKQMFFMWIQVQAGAIFHAIKVMYMSSAQDFSLGFSICKAMQHDPTACTCWLPLVVCVSSFKTTLREAEGGQWWKWVWWGLNAPLHIC